MKRVILILIVSTLFSHVFAQEDHMQFVEGDWQTLLDKAKKEKKPFFVDFYTDWCGWCKVMEKKTFNNDKVIEYVDKNYLAYQIDAEKGEGIELRKKYGINSYPTILIFDKDGNMTMRVLGYQNVNSFLDILEDSRKAKGEEAEEEPETSADALIDQYFDKKDKFYEELAELVNMTKNESIKSMEEKAYQYGQDNNHFDYSELQYAAEKDYNIPLKNRLEMYYHMGRTDKERMTKAAINGLFQKEFEEQEAHYILLLLLKNDIKVMDMLLAVNKLALKSKDYQLLDTKAAIQYFLGETKDAESTAKKAKKIGEKKNMDVSSTEFLLSKIDA